MTVLFGGLLVAGVFIVNGTELSPLSFVLAGLAGMVLSLLRLYLHSVVRPVVPVLLVPLTGLTLSLLLGAAVFFDLPRQSLRDALSPPARSFSCPDISGCIQRGRNYALYVERQTGLELGNVVLVNRREIPRMRAYGEVYWDYHTETLILPGGGEIRSSEIIGADQLSEPLILARLEEDMIGVIQSLDKPLLSLPLLALILTLSFSLSMVWTAARLTRWPLANGILALTMILLILAVPRLLVTVSARTVLVERVAFVPADLLDDYLLPSAWLVLGVIALVTGLFLPRFRRWQREMLPLGEQP
jgi:hypothetical protein